MFDRPTHLRTIALAAAALLVGAACAHRPATLDDAERQRLEQRQTDFLAALSARDLDRTIAHFADDAVLHVANMPPIEGRSAIHQFYGNVFRFLSATEPQPEMIRISRGADMAYSPGSVTNVFEGEQGPVEHTGKYLLVWERRDGDWSIAVYSISSNQADPSR